MKCLLILLDNTFIGTLLAGSLLAFFGLFLYRRQKEIDANYEEWRSIKGSVSLLFASLEVAKKNYDVQVNIYNNKNPQLKMFAEAINSKFDDYFKKESDKEFNSMTTRITLVVDDLIAKLKLNNRCLSEIDILLEQIPVLNFCILGTTVLHYSKPEDIDAIKTTFDKAYDSIREALKRIANHKV